jgi:hypothetical protein
MKPENLKIPTEIGQSLDAVINRSSKKTKRLAILCPGFLDSKDYQGLLKLAEALAERGYDVVRFDPTGVWKSDGDISQYNTTRYLADIRCVLDYMMKQKTYEHVLLGGHSRGGTVAMLYAARDSRISSVLAIMSAFQRSNSGKRAQEWKAAGFHLSSRDEPDSTKIRQFNVPYSHYEDYCKYNLFEDIKKVHVPLTMVAGELDKLVTIDDIKNIFDPANEPKKLILVKGVAHDYRKSPEGIEQVNEAILKEGLI